MKFPIILLISTKILFFVFFKEDFSETTENIKQKIVDILPNYKTVNAQ